MGLRSFRPHKSTDSYSLLHFLYILLLPCHYMKHSATLLIPQVCHRSSATTAVHRHREIVAPHSKGLALENVQDWPSIAFEIRVTLFSLVTTTCLNFNVRFTNHLRNHAINPRGHGQSPRYRTSFSVDSKFIVVFYCN